MSRRLLTAIAAFYIVVLVGTFAHNLPRFCANPEGPGNWAAQPLCK